MSIPITCDVREIMDILPHRYPFLLVDRVVEMTPGENIKAYKNVSINEPFFQGHFPGSPVMPGVLILEAMAQAGGVMVVYQLPKEEREKKIFLFTGIEKAKFRHQVVPGDRLDLECHLLRQKLQLWRIAGKAYVNDHVVAEAELSAAIVDKD